MCNYGWDIGFIDHLYTRLKTTNNYSANVNLHNSQITTAWSKSFPVYCVFTSRSLATASNNGDSSASSAQALPERRLHSNCLFSSQTPLQNWLGCPNCPPYNPLQGSSGKHRFQQYLYCCMHVRCRVMLFTEPLRRNECCFKVVR
jgi:hypothetical protein